MSIPHINAVFAATDLEPHAKLIMLALADRADKATGIARPSIADLKQRTGMSERGIQNIVRRLIAQGWLSVKWGGGRHQINEYTIANPTLDAGFQDKSNAEYNAPNAVNLVETRHSIPKTPQQVTHYPVSGAGEPLVNQRKPDEKRIVEDVTLTQVLPVQEKSRPKTKLPEDWALSEVGWDYARSKQLQDDEIREMAYEFQIYWSDRGDVGGKKSDLGWNACWQNHVRRNLVQYVRNRNLAGSTAPNGYGRGSSIASIVARRRASGTV